MSLSKKFNVFFLFLFLVNIINISPAEVTFFGPMQYTRSKGKPEKKTDFFICEKNYIGTGFSLKLANGSPEGENRVTSATVEFNGIEIIGPSDFNKKVGQIEKNVSLTTNNQISVKLKSKPGSYFIIHIYKWIDEPEVTFSANPATIDFQQSSTLNWVVTNADSIEISNGIGTVEPTGSVQVSPEVPSTTYTLTASNLGGITTKQATVEVIFPPPTVTLNISPAIIQPEGSVTLTWTSFAAHTVSIEPDIGQVELNGTHVVNPLETTTFTSNAQGYGGENSSQAMVIVDGEPPQITVVSPEPGTEVITNQDHIYINGTIEDSYPYLVTLSSCSGTSSDELIGEIVGSKFYFNNVSLAVEGENCLLIKGQDEVGNLSEPYNITIIRDTEVPQLTIFEPVNQSLTSKNSILVRGKVEDLNLKDVKVNGMIMEINADNNEFSGWVNLNEGNNFIDIEVCDKANNIKNEMILVEKDSISPNINITGPLDNTIINTPTIEVSGIADDVHLTGVKVNGQTAILNGNQFKYSNLLLNEGNTEILVEAFDSAGNSGSQSINVTLDTRAITVTKIEPADQIKGVPLMYPVKVTLSELPDESTLSSDTFYLQANGQKLEGNFSFIREKIF